MQWGFHFTKARADGDAPRARHAHVALMGAIADLGQVRHRVAEGKQPAGGGYGAAAAETAAVMPKTKNSTVGRP